MVLNFLLQIFNCKDCLTRKSGKQCQTRSDRLFGYMFAIYVDTMLSFSNIWPTKKKSLKTEEEFTMLCFKPHDYKKYKAFIFICAVNLLGVDLIK